MRLYRHVLNLEDTPACRYCVYAHLYWNMFVLAETHACIYDEKEIHFMFSACMVCICVFVCMHACMSTGVGVYTYACVHV